MRVVKTMATVAAPLTTRAAQIMDGALAPTLATRVDLITASVVEQMKRAGMTAHMAADLVTVGGEVTPPFMTVGADRRSPQLAAVTTMAEFRSPSPTPRINMVLTAHPRTGTQIEPKDQSPTTTSELRRPIRGIDSPQTLAKTRVLPSATLRRSRGTALAATDPHRQTANA